MKSTLHEFPRASKPQTWWLKRAGPFFSQVSEGANGEYFLSS